jgi:hypothetical protein
MPEQPAAPIPQDLADAFREAVLSYPDCEFSFARVAFRGQGELASTVCAMAMPFSLIPYRKRYLVACVDICFTVNTMTTSLRTFLRSKRLTRRRRAVSCS